MHPDLCQAEVSYQQAVQVIDLRRLALRIGILSKEAALDLDPSFYNPGIYLLQDQEKLYVGKGNSLYRRIRPLRHELPEWSKAALLVSTHIDGFKSHEIAWLEGATYLALNEREDIKMVNEVIPGDPTVPEDEARALEGLVLSPWFQVLEAHGFLSPRALTASRVS